MSSTVDTVVVGAGQAGLATSCWLRHYGVEHLILDRGADFGQAWHHRWHSLEMITPNWMNALPGLAYPGSPDDFSPKAVTISYLRRYGQAIAAPVRWHAPVHELRHDGSAFLVRTGADVIRARHVVLATGHYQAPRTPACAAQLAGTVQLHSSRYRAPGQVPDGEVLVVGSGNSGVAIAVELARDHDVVLARGSNPHVPRRVTGTGLARAMGAIAAQHLRIPDDGADREADVMWWLNEVGFYEMAADTPLGARLSVATSDAYCGQSLDHVAGAHGIRLAGRVQAVVDGRVMTADGTSTRPRTVVWATGYGQDYGWIDAPLLGPDGAPRHVRGVSDVAGLYLVGRRFQHTASSSLLFGMGRDARHVVEHLVRHAGRTLSGPPSGAPAAR